MAFGYLFKYQVSHSLKVLPSNSFINSLICPTILGLVPPLNRLAKIVGQMSELIKEFDGKTFKEWETWYLNKYPKAIEAAVEKITQMLVNFKDVLEKTDRTS